MAYEMQASLRAADGSELLEVLVRPRAVSSNGALRNLEGVQPPGLNRQAAFGSGIYQAGVWERPMAVCDVSDYETVGHAMAALDEAVRLAKGLRFDGWELPIAEGVGIVERNRLARGYRAVARLIPASPHWRYLTGTKPGTGSQSSLAISGSGFASTDVGRVLVFANGAEALLTGFLDANNVTTDMEQTVASQGFTIYDAATGLL